MPVFSEVTPVDSMALTQHGAAKPALASDNQLYLQTPRKSAQRTQLQLCSQPALGTVCHCSGLEVTCDS